MRYVGGVASWWAQLETEWRTLTSNKPIPTKYRTNKSVILKAERVTKDVTAWMEDGTMMGKTAVQQVCSTHDPVIRTPEAVAKTIIAMIVQYERQTDVKQSTAVINILYEWTGDRHT